MVKKIKIPKKMGAKIKIIWKWGYKGSSGAHNRGQKDQTTFQKETYLHWLIVGQMSPEVVAPMPLIPPYLT